VNPSPTGPLTRAEETGYRETSLHAHVMAYVAGLERAGDKRLHVARFGASPEGRELPLLVLSGAGVKTPREAHATGLPVVLIINGIHAGEVEGKEASLMLARDLLSGPSGDLLKKMVLVIVPLFNPDGNDRLDPANRKLDLAKLEGQIGPVVGTRVNASGINLNRDYMAQSALEMRLLTQNVYRAWQPHLTIDCHATNGSVHRFALTYDTAHAVESGQMAPVAHMREKFLPVVTERLRKRTSLETFFYGNFTFDEGATGQGWMTYTHHPRFGSNYRGLTNRMDLLAECYSYLTFHDRVFTTYEFLWEVLQLAGEQGNTIVDIVSGCQRPLDKVAIRYRLDAFKDPVEILTREPRTLEGKPHSVKIPHLANFVGTEIVARPRAYAVPPAVAEHLGLHGLAIQRLEKNRSLLVEVGTVEETSTTGSRKILETSASGEKQVDVIYKQLTRELKAGTALVPTDHPMGNIAVYLCEGQSDDGVVACGVVPAPGRGEEFPILRVLDF
jgi:hypothetical protein